MRLLAITTATARCGVALIGGGAELASRATEEGPAHAERLFRLIDEALEIARWTKRDLGAVACDIGPGSFTGVRVGLASAKGIALGLGVPVVGVGSLAAMAAAAGALRGTDIDTLMPILDARRGELFFAIHRGGAPVVPATHQTAAAVAVALREHHATACGRAGRALDPERFIDHPSCELPDARWIGLLGAQQLAARSPPPLAAIEPAYLRAPDAVPPSVPPDWRRPR